MRKKFNESVNKICIIYSYDEAFRDPKSKSTKVNKALADCIMIALEQYNLETIKSKRIVIKKSINKIIIGEDFSAGLRQKTSDTQKVNYRMQAMIDGLKNAIQL